MVQCLSIGRLYETHCPRASYVYFSAIPFAQPEMPQGVTHKRGAYGPRVSCSLPL